MNPELPAANEYVTLGLALRSLREQSGLTQKAAAAEIRIGEPFLSQIENGARGCRWHTLLSILEVYGANLRDLASAIEDARI